MHPPPILTSAKNLNLTNHIYIISYSAVIRFLYFSLLSLFQVNSLYKIEGFPIKSVIIQGISCNPPINITLKISFYSGIPSGETIKGVFQAALKGGKITNLTESNTVLTVTFTGK